MPVDVERVRALANWAFLRVLPRKGDRRGIILPPSQAEEVGYCLAEIVSLGPGKLSMKTGIRWRSDEVKEGDTVFVRKYLTEINPATNIGKSEFCFIDQADLFAEVDPNADISVERI